VHGVNTAGQQRTELARLRIDAGVCRRSYHRMFERIRRPAITR
jgi:hypothetical protein